MSHCLPSSSRPIPVSRYGSPPVVVTRRDPVPPHSTTLTVPPHHHGAPLLSHITDWYPSPGRHVTSAKVDSSSLPAASSGALDSISSLFPPSLQPYVQNTLGHLDSSVSELTDLLSTHTGLPPRAAFALTLVCAATPAAVAMWSYWSKRPTLSPYASMNQGKAPDVTEQDYSYITSRDLDAVDPAAAAAGGAGTPEDDVLLVKHRGETQAAYFPAYSIGDGKLKVHDIRDRIGVMLDLSESQTRKVRLFYKGRQLKEPGALARDYGVKNMSEILAMVREDRADGAVEGGDGGSAGGSYGPGEDGFGVEDGSSHAGSSGAGSSGKRRKGRKPRKKQPAPQQTGEEDAAAAAHRAAQMEKLDEVIAFFETDLAALCDEFVRAPPADEAKRVDQHRRLTETILHRVILRLDAVEPNGDEGVRGRRKALVKEMQDVMARLDEAKDR